MPISVRVASGSAKWRSRSARRLQPVSASASSPAAPNAGSQCAQYVNAMTSMSPSQYPGTANSVTVAMESAVSTRGPALDCHAPTARPSR